MHRLALPLSLLATLLVTSLRAQDRAAPTVVEVRGHLLDDRYQPAANVPFARLVGDPADLGPTLAAPIGHSDADGAFAVKVTLDTATPTALLVGGKRFALHRLALTPGQPLVELGFVALPRGFTTAGRVRTVDGTPPADARVTGRDLLSGPPLVDRRFDDDFEVLAPFTSSAVDQRGFFRLPGLVRSGAELHITGAGHVDHVVRPFGMDQPLDVTLRAARVLRGTVRRDDAPLAGAAVSAGAVRVTTDRDGAFALPLADPETRRLVVEVGSGFTALRQHVAVPDAEQPLQVTIDRPAATRRWQLVVQDAEGRTVECFETWLTWTTVSNAPHRATPLLFEAALAHGHHEVSTDGTVQFTAPTADAPWQGVLLLRAPGHGWGQLCLDGDNAGEPSTVVVLPAPRTVSGRVVDADGAPVAGVVIVPTRTTLDNWRRDLELGVERLTHPTTNPDAVTTDADGAFTMTDLPPESLDLLLLDGHGFASLQSLDLTAGAPDAPIMLRLPRRQTIAGRITGVQRDDLMVRLFANEAFRVDVRGADRIDGAQRLGRDGRFELRSPTTGEHRPEVVLPRAPRNRSRVKLRVPQGADGTHSLPSLRMVEGHVTCAAPWSRLAVIATQRPDTDAGVGSELLRQIAPLEPDGTFHLLLPVGDTRLLCVEMTFGVVLHFVDVPAAKLGAGGDWQVPATAFDVEMHRETAYVDQRVTVRFEPDAGLALPARAGLTTEFDFDTVEAKPQRPFHLLDAWPDERFTLWLPAKSGTLHFHRMVRVTVPLDRAPTHLRLRVDKNSVELLR